MNKFKLEVFIDPKIEFYIDIIDNKITFTGSHHYIFQFLKRLGTNTLHNSLIETLESLSSIGVIPYNKWIDENGNEFFAKIKVSKLS